MDLESWASSMVDGSSDVFLDLLGLGSWEGFDKNNFNTDPELQEWIWNYIDDGIEEVKFIIFNRILAAIMKG
jgi:hypothetical protein